MTAFSDAFRSEVLRMARKEIKSELGALRQTVTNQRAEIAALKRDLKDLRSQVQGLRKATTRGAPSAPAARESAGAGAGPGAATSTRRTPRGAFHAPALAAKRAQLGLSQQAMAQLLEASALSVSKWESGKVTPRAAQLERIQAVLRMGKRAALAQLQG